MHGTLLPQVEFDCEATVEMCIGLSGFCDCDGDGKLDDAETGFDCPDPGTEVSFSCRPKYCPAALLQVAEEQISKPVQQHSAASYLSA